MDKVKNFNITTFERKFSDEKLVVVHYYWDHEMSENVAALYYIEGNSLVSRLDVQCDTTKIDITTSQYDGRNFLLLPIDVKLQGFTLICINNSGLSFVIKSDNNN